MRPYLESINLHGKRLLDLADTGRQSTTARAILDRLHTQPGVILADEVGMGKTFVALAVAASVALAQRERRPVVIMAPAALKEKWPGDCTKFRESCLPHELAGRLTSERAESAMDFLRLLDRPADATPRLIFLTHGAMTRALRDPWMKLALMRRALSHKPDASRIKRVLASCACDLLRQKSKRFHETLWLTLLERPPSQWAELIDPENPEQVRIPQVILDSLERGDVEEIYQNLQRLRRGQRKFEEVTDALTRALKAAWPGIVKKVGQEQKLPLLILDEAHHVKNNTTLARLFADEEAEKDAGMLAGAFEHMLFLTATPFQLGHGELCNVLERFKGVHWARNSDRENYSAQLTTLRETLAAAHLASVQFDAAWARLRCGQDWQRDPAVTEKLASVRVKMAEAQRLLQPWVIRHQRSRLLNASNSTPRRIKLPGRSMTVSSLDAPVTVEQGIEIADDDVLPFLLAARATLAAPGDRPVFADGLASSYEAFRNTQSQRLNADELPVEWTTGSPGETARFYLRELNLLLEGKTALHPKVKATVDRVVQLWRAGEKVVVFCHYRATGRLMERLISDRLREEIVTLHPWARLERWQKRLSDRKAPARETCNRLVSGLLASHPDLRCEEHRLQRIVRRFLRTPAMLARHVPRGTEALGAITMERTFDHADHSGMTLREKIAAFLRFLDERCGKDERETVLEALLHISTAEHSGKAGVILPNVSWIHGDTGTETRQRVMRTFNSPFLPEIMIASSVMAEGVDLHLFCRHVIHHDLSWNPSSIEQRTGRVDRLGCKAEQVQRSIHTCLPFLAGTQDEKQYAVVTDRERWFGVLMGGGYEPDKLTVHQVENLADRLPLPPELAAELSLDLRVVNQTS